MFYQRAPFYSSSAPGLQRVQRSSHTPSPTPSRTVTSGTTSTSSQLPQVRNWQLGSWQMANDKWFSLFFLDGVMALAICEWRMATMKYGVKLVKVTRCVRRFISMMVIWFTSGLPSSDDDSFSGGRSQLVGRNENM